MNLTERNTKMTHCSSTPSSRISQLAVFFPANVAPAHNLTDLLLRSLIPVIPAFVPSEFPTNRVLVATALPSMVVPVKKSVLCSSSIISFILPSGNKNLIFPIISPVFRLKEVRPSKEEIIPVLTNPPEIVVVPIVIDRTRTPSTTECKTPTKK